MRNLIFAKLLFLASMLVPAVSHASLVVEAPIGPSFATLTFDARPYQEITLGPVSLNASNGNEVTFTATSGFETAGFSWEYYGLGTNGVWAAADHSYAWVNGGEGGGIGSTMRFTFTSGPTSSVGGFLNYVKVNYDPYFYNPYYWYDAAFFAIRAIGADGSVLEEYLLDSVAPIHTSGLMNAGAFRGISRDTADIYAFEIRGVGVIRDLQFAAPLLGPITPPDQITSQVPEPSEALLVSLGLLVIVSKRGIGGKKTRI